VKGKKGTTILVAFKSRGLTLTRSSSGDDLLPMPKPKVAYSTARVRRKVPWNARRHFDVPLRFALIMNGRRRSGIVVQAKSVYRSDEIDAILDIKHKLMNNLASYAELRSRPVFTLQRNQNTYFSNRYFSVSWLLWPRTRNTAIFSPALSKS
jgi:hypothetical protein